MKSYGLKEDTVNAILEVFQDHPNIDKCIIYGSRAMSNYRHASDIDLTLIGKNLTLSELLQIENELDDLLLPYKIDLSIFHQINHSGLREHIEKKGKVFFENALKFTHK
jgi:predicted nucleotidyltransferase